MDKLKFIVEKNDDGYWAHREEQNGVIGAYGEDLSGLKADIVKACNLFHGGAEITHDDISLQFDVSSFFEIYSGIVAAAGIGKRAGVQKSLISEYVKGKKKPSKKQIDRLLSTIKQLGRELSEVEIA